MSVYVDDMEASFGRMKMCHMWADTLDELLAMADLIGVQRRWLQRPSGSWDGHDPRYQADARLRLGMDASWVHFDIAKGKRAAAIAAGAIVTDQFGPGEYTAKLSIATGIPGLVNIGERRLQLFADARLRLSAAE
ncbi:DUF4031 domain-containing protein [Devosia ginsengisoli]|uniref:DUF4031 domain-containing protein n=1 Tax=Devosia ginsengisoli TaxID=400770 RepID=UPI0026EFCA77|nr:DUF4031 domain-containing protein [Devosia ginsengisoli]MCR6672172.1 DUF4031 domain-containing protein [Devosia ginsengisoli]